MNRSIVTWLILCMGTAVQAGVVYRSVDADGQVTYSSQAPTDAVTSREIDVLENLPPESLTKARNELKALLERADELVERRMQRNLELSRERNRLQQSADERRAMEALLQLQREQNRGYPAYARPSWYAEHWPLRGQRRFPSPGGPYPHRPPRRGDLQPRLYWPGVTAGP